jgi:hypothetical protein
MTNMTETIRLPSGNRGIVLPNRDVVDPCYVTAKNLVNMGPSEYAVVSEWIEAERLQRSERLVAADAAVDRAAIHAEVEARHKAQKEYADAHPWTK